LREAAREVALIYSTIITILCQHTLLISLEKVLQTSVEKEHEILPNNWEKVTKWQITPFISGGRYIEKYL
jgi:hypothetical protein